MAGEIGQRACAAAAAATPPTGAVGRRRPKPNPLAGRIRRIMKADDDVGKISQAAPGMMGEPLRFHSSDLSPALQPPA